MKIKVVLTGRSYDLAAEIPDEWELDEGATLNQLLGAINEKLNQHPLSPSCLIAIAGKHCGTVGQHQDCVLEAGQELVLLQPVAGG